MDFSGELTFAALAVDPDIAVSVLRDDLQEHDLADEAVIAVEQAGSYVAVWPKQPDERSSEHAPAGPSSSHFRARPTLTVARRDTPSILEADEVSESAHRLGV